MTKNGRIMYQNWLCEIAKNPILLRNKKLKDY